MEKIIKILKTQSEADDVDYRFFTKDKCGYALWTEEPILNSDDEYMLDDIEGSEVVEINPLINLNIKSPFIFKLNQDGK